MADLVVTLTGNEEDSTDVTIGFTMANKALEKGHSVDMILFSKSVFLAEKDYADKINIGEPFDPLSELLSNFITNGGTLKVCKGCMVSNKVEEENLIDKAVVINAGDVIDTIMNAKKSLQFN